MTQTTQLTPDARMHLVQKEITFNRVLKAAKRIQSADNRRIALLLIESGRVNADDTVFADKACTVAEWDKMFRGTVSFMLANCKDASKHVHAFLGKFGIIA